MVPPDAADAKSTERLLLKDTVTLPVAPFAEYPLRTLPWRCNVRH